MQCANPLLMEIELDGKVYTTTCRCLKCYACQCSSRAEWSVRCKYEMRDPRNKSCHFITLTYDEGHLPCMDVPFFDVQKRHHLNQQLPSNQRRYWYSYLRKDHAMKFLRDMNQELQRYFRPYFVDVRTGEVMMTDSRAVIRGRWNLEKWCRHIGISYKKTHYRDVYPKDHHFRVFMTGEYGDISHRSHYHLICFSPVELSKMDYLQLVPKCWPYGQINVGESCTAAACNYVAKHQVKSCLGTDFQNSTFPIFSLSSHYLGGIGNNMKYDQDLRVKWENSLINHSKAGLYISNVQKDNAGVIREFKVHFPRFLTTIYHPQKLDEYELTDLMHEASKNLKRFICNNHELFPSLQNDNFELTDCDFKVEQLTGDSDHPTSDDHFQKMRSVKTELHRISSVLLEQDRLRREQYERTRLHKKLKKLSKPTSYNNFNSE